MPKVKIRYSKDGGYTWSHWSEHSLAGVGDFLTRVVKRRMGQARHWVLDISVTDPVRADLISGSAQIEQRE